MNECRYNEMIESNKIKSKYHEKFRKNINHKVSYFKQLLERAWSEKENHSAYDPNIRPVGPTLKDREELKVLNELIKLYQLQLDLKEGTKPVKYYSC